jgi:hypothetical protein
MPIKQSLTQASPYVETAGRLRNTPERGHTHTARDADLDPRNTTRQLAEADAFTWKDGTSLDAPPPQPGMRQKWIRISFRSESDEINWSKRFQEGWRPRHPDTIPEELRGYYPVREHDRQSMIRSGNLVLCEMPEARIAARARWVKSETERQIASISVETDKTSREMMRKGSVPLVREEQVTTDIGRRPATLAD